MKVRLLVMIRLILEEKYRNVSINLKVVTDSIKNKKSSKRMENMDSTKK